MAIRAIYHTANSCDVSFAASAGNPAGDGGASQGRLHQAVIVFVTGANREVSDGGYAVAFLQDTLRDIGYSPASDSGLPGGGPVHMARSSKRSSSSLPWDCIQAARVAEVYILIGAQ